MSKTCTSCATRKPLDEFHRHPAGALGRQSKCKACSQTYHSAYYKKRKEADPEWFADLKLRARMSQYGLTREQWDDLWSEPWCEVCKRTDRLCI